LPGWLAGWRLSTSLSGYSPRSTVLLTIFHTSDEERDTRRAELAKLQNEALALALALERERLAAQAGLVSAEAGGASWLQRNWRPITMLSFLGLVVADAFGLLAFRLADQAWLLLQIGLGGYVVGRSVEKISPQITAIANNPPPRTRPRAKPKLKPQSGTQWAVQRTMLPADAEPALRALITRREGRRRFAYRDSLGILSIGVGRNLQDRGLADDEIDLSAGK
jgi:hypothetical protein